MGGTTQADLLEFISKQLVSSEDWGELTADDDLVDTGILDSQAILRLAAHLERAYGIKVEQADIVPAHFGSVTALVGFVARKRGET